jgi:hypothetical protein
MEGLTSLRFDKITEAPVTLLSVLQPFLCGDDVVCLAPEARGRLLDVFGDAFFPDEEDFEKKESLKEMRRSTVGRKAIAIFSLLIKDHFRINVVATVTESEESRMWKERLMRMLRAVPSFSKDVGDSSPASSHALLDTVLHVAKRYHPTNNDDDDDATAAAELEQLQGQAHRVVRARGLQ